MVDVSDELSVETERRLRGVLGEASVEEVDGVWQFVRWRDAPPADALATVRDADGWCALVRANSGGDGGREEFAVTRIVFPAGVDNSGFVGWLASAIKRETGSGVFVVCGDNPARGGIFDYWGYPPSVAPEITRLLASLRAEPPRDPLSLDLRVFRVTRTSETSVISEETVFEFHEASDGVVEASYGGGRIGRGYLVGRREGHRVEFASAQTHAGTPRSGRSTARLEAGVGSLRLVESFAFADGRIGTNVLESVQ